MKFSHLPGEWLASFPLSHKPHLIVWALGLLIIAALPGSMLSSDPHSLPAPTLRVIEQQVHRDVNQARQDYGLRSLKWNEELAAEARRHAANMVRKGFFEHTDPSRGDIDVRLDQSGIRWSRCAENLYEEKGLAYPAKEAVNAWLHSRSHRKNMLDRTLEETGIGAAFRKDGTVVIVQVFLSR